MSLTRTLPAIDDCIDLYLAVSDRYGDEAFRPSGLSPGLGDGDEAASSDDDSTVRRLELLCAYGLLDRRADGTYEVRCAPGDSLEHWRASYEPRIETLYRLVEESKRSPSAERSGGDDSASLWLDGDAFARIRISGEPDEGSTRRRVRSLLEARPSVDGVVLCSPGERAATVQRIADELCGAETAEGVPPLEKETTELAGADKDRLEFRLFLRRDE